MGPYGPYLSGAFVIQVQAFMNGGDPHCQAVPPYSVKRFASGDGPRWDEFVRESANGSFFHLSGWKSIIENQLHHPTYYLYCESDGNIEAVLPLVHVKSLLFGNSLISIPFLVYGGPVATNHEALNCVINAARELASELAVDHLELRNQEPLGGIWQTKDTYATFRKRIDPDLDKNLMAIPRKQRAMIRKGTKAGLKAEIDQDTKRLFSAMLTC